MAVLARIHDLLAAYIAGDKAQPFPVPASPVTEARAALAAGRTDELVACLTPWAAA